MMQWAYLGSLVLSLGCIVLEDRRWRLVLWPDVRRSIAVLAAGMLLFLVWDLAALRLGLYRGGDSAGMTGVELAPDLPLEELFFIAFLCYLTLVLHRLVHLLLPSRAERGVPHR